MDLYIFFIVCLWIPFQAECVDYCDIDSCSDKKEHVACKNPELKPDDGCTMLKIKDHKARILASHNMDRNEVACGAASDQPSASNMKRLTWDKELETLAERNAMSCKMEHDKCRDVPRFKVGQNLLQASNLDLALESMDSGWYGEKKDFKSDGIKTFKFDEKTGHYTQMVWANSQYVGCAMSKKGDDHFMACNYGPAGNMEGGEMYKTGKAASDCPSGFKKDRFYKGLCSFSPSLSSMWFLRTLNLYVAVKRFLL